MTAPEFTVDGVSIQTFEEIFEELADDYRGIYGPDINLDQDSPDGQRVGIESKTRLDLQTFVLQLYTQLDPDFSSGEFQTKIIKWAGIRKRAATKSTVEVTITTDRVLTLDTNYIVKDTTGQEWATTSSNALILGANTITLTAVLWGNIEAGIDTVTEPSTVVLGVLSVTNPAIAVAGIEEETEEELRARRNKSLELAAYSTTGSLFARLANLNGVTDLAVYENDTKTDDPTIPLEANTIWVVIEGGEVADIAEVIAKEKTGGTPLKGTETATYTENLLKPDGTTFVFIHNIKYDRPSDKTLWVELTATRKDAAVPLDLPLIKAEIAKKLYAIKDDAMATELYSYGYNAGTNFVLTDMKISDDDITYTDDDLASDHDEKWLIEVANITVTEVI